MNTDQQSNLSSTSSYFEDVAEFHQAVLMMEKKSPCILDDATMSHRMSFMFEELSEFRDAHDKQDLVGMADALGDLVYVALGTAYQMGIPFDGVWAAIQKANMAKVPGMTKRLVKVDAKKPEGWVGPEATIKQLIEDASKS